MTRNEVFYCVLNGKKYNGAPVYMAWYKTATDSKERLKLFHTLREVKPWIILHPDYILTADSYKILGIYERQRHSLARYFVN